MSTNNGLGSPRRIYVILQQKFDTRGDYFVEIYRVKSNNTINALRKACKEIELDVDEAILVAVSESMWRPRPVTSTSGTTVIIGK
jgi:hypothetical protein